MYLSQADPMAGMYLSEKDRFNIRGKSEVDFQVVDKHNKYITNNCRIEKLKEHEKDQSQKSFMNDLIREEKRNYSLLQRSKHMVRYETVRLVHLI